MAAADDKDPGTGGEAPLHAVGGAFARLRRRTPLVPVDPPFTRKDISRNQVINVIDEAGAEEMTVGGVAAQLSVDPSVASRMVADCIDAGYVARRASQHDGRRSVLELTEAGTALRDQFRSQHRQAFMHITRDWPEDKRLQFARLLIEYVEAASAATAHTAHHDDALTSPGLKLTGRSGRSRGGSRHTRQALCRHPPLRRPAIPAQYA